MLKDNLILTLSGVELDLDNTETDNDISTRNWVSGKAGSGYSALVNEINRFCVLFSGIFFFFLGGYRD